MTGARDMNKRFSEITRDEWGSFYWANGTGACDSEARFVRGEPRPTGRVGKALAEYDRLVGTADEDRRQLPYEPWEAT
jgi:hypothetical protein